MIYTVSKKFLALSVLSLAILATTFTFAKDNKENSQLDNHGEKNYLSGTHEKEDKKEENRLKNNLLSGNVLSGKILTTGQIECVKTAVDKRETAIITSTTSFQTAILSALNTRKTDLLASRSLTTKEQIKSAVKKSRDTFKSSKKTAKEILRKSETTAWKTFKTDVKACKVSSTFIEMEKDNEETRTID